MPAIKSRDISFLELCRSVLCSECELISYNNTAHCLACGSSAVLNLSRVLGSLQGEQRTRLIANQSLNKVIEMPSAPPRRPPMPADVPPMPGRVMIASGALQVQALAATPAHSAMKLVAERAYRLSRSGGAAIAAERNGRLVCEARAGLVAPPLGAEVRGGISVLSARTARTLRCDLADDDPRVDAASCRSLGVKSVVAAPVTNLDRVLGLVSVYSPQPYAFDDRDVAVVQWLAGMMAVAFTSGPADLSLMRKSGAQAELLTQA